MWHSDLIAYLIAAHHGKVRLSLRSMPNESGDPQDSDRKFARGIWEGDSLPAFPIGNGDVTEAVSMSLDLMLLGNTADRPSWLTRCMKLRDAWGPFRLAYFETLVRIADWRGSDRESGHES